MRISSFVIEYPRALACATQKREAGNEIKEKDDDKSAYLILVENFISRTANFSLVTFFTSWSRFARRSI